MARPLVHRMVHTQDRPGFQGGSEWACPFCPHQVVYWPLHHKVMVKGQAEVLHVRAIKEVPVHLDDIVLELTEADENWLTLNAIAWSGVVADDVQLTAPVWEHGPLVAATRSARQVSRPPDQVTLTPLDGAAAPTGSPIALMTLGHSASRPAPSARARPR